MFPAKSPGPSTAPGTQRALENGGGGGERWPPQGPLETPYLSQRKADEEHGGVDLQSRRGLLVHQEREVRNRGPKCSRCGRGWLSAGPHGHAGACRALTPAPELSQSSQVTEEQPEAQGGHLPGPGPTARCAPDPVPCYFESWSRGRGRGRRGSRPPACLQAPSELRLSVGATLACAQAQVLWGAPRGARCWVLALPAPAALASCSCRGRPWLSAHRPVQRFPRESRGSPRQTPAAKCIKEEAFLPGSSTRATGVRPRVTLQLRQEASH